MPLHPNFPLLPYQELLEAAVCVKKNFLARKGLASA